VLLYSGEQIHDPASHCEVPTPFHQISADVTGVDQPVGQRVEVNLIANAKHHRLQISQPLDQRLEHRANWGDHHGDGAGAWVGRIGVRKSAEHRQPATHSV
jgi:hypothetical protein